VQLAWNGEATQSRLAQSFHHRLRDTARGFGFAAMPGDQRQHFSSRFERFHLHG
jgi:hypothetical protein